MILLERDKYYWVIFKKYPNDPPIIAQCDNRNKGQMSICGSDEIVYDTELLILKEVEPYN